MEKKINFEFDAVIWQFSGTNGWFFVSLPPNIAREIRENLKWQEEGWGRMKATARIGSTEWETAIWFDKKRNTYLLPLKLQIRKTEGLNVNDNISVIIGI